MMALTDDDQRKVSCIIRLNDIGNESSVIKTKTKITMNTNELERKTIEELKMQLLVTVEKNARLMRIINQMIENYKLDKKEIVERYFKNKDTVGFLN